MHPGNSRVQTLVVVGRLRLTMRSEKIGGISGVSFTQDHIQNERYRFVIVHFGDNAVHVKKFKRRGQADALVPKH